MYSKSSREEGAAKMSAVALDCDALPCAAVEKSTALRFRSARVVKAREDLLTVVRKSQDVRDVEMM